jgi:transcription initiation factor IIE alpha subunit
LNLVSSFLKRNPIFCELNYKFALDNFHKTGLDVLFYGQEHFDTLAILSMKQEMTKEKVADLMTNQRLLSNKDLMIKNLEQLIENLRECETYISEVLGN